MCSCPIVLLFVINNNKNGDKQNKEHIWDAKHQKRIPVLPISLIKKKKSTESLLQLVHSHTFLLLKLRKGEINPHPHKIYHKVQAQTYKRWFWLKKEIYLGFVFWQLSQDLICRCPNYPMEKTGNSRGWNDGISFLIQYERCGQQVYQKK